MQGFTDEQKRAWEAENRRAAIEDRAPDPAAWGCGPDGKPLRPPPPGGEPPTAVGAPEPGEHRPRSSDRDLLRRARVRGVEYYLPGADEPVWVHPSSGKDAELIITWTANAAPKTPDGRQLPLSAGDATILPLIHQVICCVKGGADPDARRVWSLEDRDEIRKCLSYEVLTEIVAKSGALGQSEEVLGGVARDFFAYGQVCLESWLSAFGGSDACPTGLMDLTTQWLSLARGVLSRGRLGSGISDGLAPPDPAAPAPPP